MALYVYVDNSNVWIEGKYHSAVHQGIIGDVRVAHENNLCDMGWRYDFGKLLDVITKGKKDVKEAVLFGSKPPENDSLWDMASVAGFSVKTESRNAAGKEKGVDTGFVVRIMEDLYSSDISEDDTFVIVAGDADYIPVVRAIKNRNIRVVIVFWNNVSGKLKDMADQYIDLNQYIDEIRWPIITNND